MLSNIKVIVFDLDDTLYLQRSYKVSGFHEVANFLSKNYGYDFYEILLHLLKILDEYGPSYPNMFDELQKRIRNTDLIAQELITVFLDHKPKIKCFKGVKELLDRLGKQFKLGILTDGNWKIQKKKLITLGIENYFDKIILSDTHQLSKPSPQLYEMFEAHFGLSSSNFCYIGDNPNKDFIEAKRRGWLTIRVLTGEFAILSCSEEFNAAINLKNVNQIKQLL